MDSKDVKNQGIRIVGSEKAAIVDLPDRPELPADDYILVRTTAVALNPTDNKHIHWAEKVGCINTLVGCDYAGIVEEVGPGVTKQFKKGDRICGPVNGS
jgi:NADPH:quinone reductase-like Zn-dependent oxidoreductase